MTKIAFFMHNMGIGGVETVLINTINALLKNGVQITLYSHRPVLEPTHIAWLKRHPNINVEIYYPHAPLFENYKNRHSVVGIFKRICFDMYKAYRDIFMARRVRAQNFDAIIDYISGYSARPFKKIHKIPKITWIHCSWNYFCANNLVKHFDLYDKIVTISDSFLSDFQKTYPQYADRAVRIYNPVNIDEIRRKAKSGTQPGGKYFACISRLDIDKDIPTLLRAFDKFWQYENRPDVKLYIVGGGTLKTEFEKLAKTLSASRQIVFTGKKSNPFGYMAGAIAHVLSSYNEGFGQVLIESMATDTLNISSNCPSGPAEVLLKGHAGILFEPGNIDELAGIMSNVYGGKIKTKTLINNAKKSLSRFDSKQIATQITDLISKVRK